MYRQQHIKFNDVILMNFNKTAGFLPINACIGYVAQPELNNHGGGGCRNTLNRVIY
jgi:hypothetical protein